MKNREYHGFFCPKCGGPMWVYKTKHPEGPMQSIKRYRKCKDCGHPQSTIEMLVLTDE